MNAVKIVTSATFLLYAVAALLKLMVDATHDCDFFWSSVLVISVRHLLAESLFHHLVPKITLFKIIEASIAMRARRADYVVHQLTLTIIVNGNNINASLQCFSQV